MRGWRQLPRMRRLAAVALAMAALATARPGGAQDGAAEPPAAETQSAETTATEVVQLVRVQVRVLEWQLNDLMDFDFAVLFNQNSPGSILQGGDLTLPSSMPLSSAARVFLSGMDAGNGTFDAVIEALESYAAIEVLSQPELVLTVGEDESDGGVVSNSTRIPYETVTAFGATLAATTEFSDVGVKLECKVPKIRYGELIHLDLTITVSDQVGSIVIGTDKNNNPMPIPIRDTRDMRCQLMVTDGAILIAGLLKTSREVERRRGIPIISEIPPFRWFLRNKTRRFAWDNEYTELIFLVRADILEPIVTSK